MVLQSQTTIRIGSKIIEDYKNLAIHQEIAAHHEVQLVVAQRNLEPEKESFSFNSKDFLGKKINIHINTLALQNEANAFEFDGIITSIKNVKNADNNEKDEVIIIAKSPTIRMDDGAHYSSYSELSLLELVDKIYLPYESDNSTLDIEPMDDVFIPYSVQNGCSSFAYISRLAAQYGEWFYYNGKKLVFGKPDYSELNLSRSNHLKCYDISLHPIANNHQYFSNDYVADEVLSPISIASKDLSSGVNGYIGFTNKKSNDIFNQEKSIWHNLSSEIQVEETLEKDVIKQRASTEINQMKLTGISDSPQIKLGGIIIIEEQKYRVIKLVHFDSKSGAYENHFEAISAELDAYPYTDIESFPMSQSQTACVVDNADPEKMGRIQVQFPWQKKSGNRSPWIRIVSSHAGSDKGFQFIPEIGEEVLIGFEGGNAERPYMLGSLYNGAAKAESWHSQNNDIKAIRTRSGHTIEFNDKDGAETIKIHDNEGSIIAFDTQSKSLSIISSETIDIQAKNINITAEEEVNIQAKGNINTASEKNTVIQSEEKISVQSKDNLECKSDAGIIIEAKDSLDQKSKEINIVADKKAILKSSNTTVEGKSTVVKGSSNKLKIV